MISEKAIIASGVVKYYDLRDIEDTIPVDTNIIFPAAHATLQPINLALNKPVWATNAHYSLPISRAVDGNVHTSAGIFTTDGWPFLVVDMGGLVTVARVLVNINERECHV